MQNQIFNIIKNHAVVKQFSGHEALMSLGIDSMKVIELVLDIESNFDIVIPDQYLNESSFRSPVTINELIEKILCEEGRV